jgi:hypothetical protein
LYCVVHSILMAACATGWTPCVPPTFFNKHHVKSDSIPVIPAHARVSSESMQTGSKEHLVLFQSMHSRLYC